MGARRIDSKNEDGMRGLYSLLFFGSHIHILNKLEHNGNRFISLGFAIILLAWTPSIGFSSNFVTDDFSLIQTAYGGPVGNTLSGFIIDKEITQPIAGAIVSIPELQKEAESDLLGFYRIDGIPSITSDVKAEVDGYTTIIELDLDLTQRWTRQDFELSGNDGQIPPRITGFVRDRNTAVPLIDATVTIANPPGTTNPDPDFPMPIVLKTSNVGQYKSGPLPGPFTYAIKSEQNGYQTKSTQFFARAGTPELHTDPIVDFYLKADPFTVSGKVEGFVGGDGLEGIPDIKIRAKFILTDPDGTVRDEIYKETTTGVGGTYTLSDLPPGNFEIIAFPSSYTEKTISLVLKTGGAHDIPNQDFTFNEKAKIDVEVASSAYGDLPVPNILVSLRTVDTTFSVGRDLEKQETTDDMGMVTFDNLPSGNYEIFIERFPTDDSTLGEIQFQSETITKRIFALDPANELTEKFDLTPIPWTMEGEISQKNGLTKIGEDKVRDETRTIDSTFVGTDMLSLNTEIPIKWDESAFIDGGSIEGKLSEGTHCGTAEFSNCFPLGPSGNYLYNLESLEGATVKVINLEFMGQSVDSTLFENFEATTNALGEYSIPNILPGFVTVEIDKVGFIPKQFSFAMPSPAALITPESPECASSDLPGCSSDGSSWPNHPVYNGDGINLFSLDAILRPPTENLFINIHGVLMGQTFDKGHEKRIKLDDATITVTTPSGSSKPVMPDEFGMYVVKDIPLDFIRADYDPSTTDLREFTRTVAMIKIEAPGYTTIEIPRTISSLEDYDTIDSSNVITGHPHGFYYAQELMFLKDPATLEISSSLDIFRTNTAGVEELIETVTVFTSVFATDTKAVHLDTRKTSSVMNHWGDVLTSPIGRDFSDFVEADEGAFAPTQHPDFGSVSTPLNIQLHAGSSYDFEVPFTNPFDFGTDICRFTFNNVAANSAQTINLKLTQLDGITTKIQVIDDTASAKECGDGVAPIFYGGITVIDEFTKQPIPGVTVQPKLIVPQCGSGNICAGGSASSPIPAPNIDEGTTDENGFFKSSVAPPVGKGFPFDDPSFERFGRDYIVVTDFLADLTKEPDYKMKTDVKFGEKDLFSFNPVIGTQEFVNVVLLTPRPQIKANIIETTQTDGDGKPVAKFSETTSTGAFLPGAKLFVEKAKSTSTEITLNYGLFFGEGDNNAGTGLTSTGEQPARFTYTISANAPGFYPLDKEGDNPITVTLGAQPITVTFELEPIPKPIVVEESFGIISPSLPGDPTLNPDKKLHGVIIKGIDNDFTKDAEWEIQINRGVLRPDFKDSVLGVNLKVMPKETEGLCKTDEDKGLAPEDLVKVFKGTFESGDKDMISVWKGKLDPSKDLPCGDLDFVAEVVTTELGMIETESFVYDIYPSYLLDGLVDLIFSVGSFASENLPDFMTSTDTETTISQAIFGEIVIGKTKVEPAGSAKHLDYKVSKVAIKTDFGLNKIVNSDMAEWAGISKIPFPSILAESDNTKIEGVSGNFDSDMKLDFGIKVGELSPRGKQPDPLKPNTSLKKLAIELESKSFANSGGKVKKIFRGIYPKISLDLASTYSQKYTLTQGVDNPIWEETTGGTSNTKILEAFKPSAKLGVGVTAPIGSTLLAWIPPLSAGLRFLEIVGFSLIDVNLASEAKPALEFTGELEKFDIYGPEFRVPKENAPTSTSLSYEIAPSAGLGLANNRLKATLKPSGVLTATFATPAEIANLNVEPTTMKGLKIEGEIVAEFEISVPLVGITGKKPYSTGKAILWERSWESESVAYVYGVTNGPVEFPTTSGDSVAFVVDDDGDLISVTPATDEDVVEGLIRTGVYSSPTLSIDTNNAGEAVFGFIGHDSQRNPPESLEAEYMFFTDNTFSFTDPEFVGETTLMPDISGPSIRYLNDGKVMAVWNTIDDTIIEPYELILDSYMAEVKYAIFDPASATWSESSMLTLDEFSDIAPIIEVDDVTGQVLAVWLKDKDGYPITTDDQSIYYSIWNGVSWSPPTVIIDGVDTLGFDIAFENGKAVLVYTHTGAASNVVHLTEFESGVWSVPQLVSDGEVDSVAGVELNSGVGTVIWAQRNIDEFYPTLYMRTFASSLSEKQFITKVGNVIDLNTAEIDGTTVVAWSQSILDDTSLNYAEFDGTSWQIFTAIELEGFDIPIIEIESDESTSKLLISYYKEIDDVFDLGFYRTVLNPAGVAAFVAPEDPIDPRLSLITGVKFADVNSNGIFDAEEKGVNGWKIILEDELGNELATATTDAAGNYLFDVNEGIYFVKEDQSNTDWVLSFPILGGLDGMCDECQSDGYLIDIEADSSFDTADFGNVPSKFASIYGTKLIDNDLDGVTEGPGEGHTIELLDSENNLLQSFTTDIDGKYWFEFLAPGTFIVQEADDPDFVTTSPNLDDCPECREGFYEIVLGTDETFDGADFVNSEITDDGGGGDNVPPVLEQPDNITVQAADASGAVVNYAVPGATDDTDPDPAVVCNSVSGSTFPIGDTTVTCTATDSSGNSSQITFTIIVEDLPTNPPIIQPSNSQTLTPTTTQIGFSEPVDGTFNAADWDVDGCRPATGITPSGPQTDIVSITLTHCDLANPATTPDVTYDASTGDLQDQASTPNVMETQTITVPDGIAPSLVGGCTISSDNPFDSLLATIGDTITVECTADEDLSVPPPSDVQILNRNADSVSVGSPTLTATQTIVDGDSTGNPAVFDILFADVAGNQGRLITEADLTGPNVLLDTNGLSADTFTIESDNPNDNKQARAADTLNIIFNANENIMPPLPGDIIVFGNPATVTGTTPSGFTAEYTLLGTEPDGPVPIMINFDDLAGNNVMVTQDSITVGGNVIVDNTIPTFVNGAFIGGNSALVNFIDPVNAVPGDFINLDVNSAGPPDPRNINSISGSGTNVILINFDGSPIPPGNDGIIDIGPGVTDFVGNPLTPLVGVPLDAGSMDITLVSPSTTTPLTDDFFIETIDATSVPAPELLLSGLTGGAGTATFPPIPITFDTGLATITFPPGVTATGLPGDEILEVSVSTKTATGISGDIGTIIELGDPLVDISFDAPIRVLIPNKAGGSAFFINAAGITIEILTACPADDLAAVTALIIPGPPNECFIYVGNDLVIWTNHFTGFGAGSGAVMSGGSSGGDRTPPKLDTVSIFGAKSLQKDGTLGFGGILQKEIKLVNSMPTAIVETGTDITFRVLLYENGGKDALSHITLYTNVHNSNSKVSDSDTYLRYNDGEVTLKDPNGIFSKGNISFVQRGSSVEVVFELTTEKTMELSDILVRAWDNKRNSVDAKFVDAIKIVPGTQQTVETESDTKQTIEFGGTVSQQDDSEPLLNMQIIKDWGGFSNNSVSDSEMLSYLGIEGDYVPSWMKHSKITKWVLDGKVTQQELVNALKYLEKEGWLIPA